MPPCQAGGSDGLSSGHLETNRAQEVVKNDRGEAESEQAKLDGVRQITWDNIFPALLDHLALYRVPHAWFTHFYIVSVLSSLFWLYQALNHGIVLRFLADAAELSSSASSNAKFYAPRGNGTTPHMSTSQIWLLWLLMLIQGLRRLYECVTLGRPSSATMWIGHYVLGIGFYVLMGPALWVEGLATLVPERNPGAGNALPVWTELAKHGRPLSTRVSASLRTAIALLAFIVASAAQSSAHRHLASLPRYTLPTHLLFRQTVAPHYLAEIIIYLSLAVLAAPDPQVVNRTVLTAAVFVAVNLGITAKGTKEWYQARFGGEAMKGRWTLFPGIW